MNILILKERNLNKSKYETSWIISRPLLQGKHVFSTENPAEDLNDITIQLSPNVLTQKRTGACKKWHLKNGIKKNKNIIKKLNYNIFCI